MSLGFGNDSITVADDVAGHSIDTKFILLQYIWCILTQKGKFAQDAEPKQQKVSREGDMGQRTCSSILWIIAAVYVGITESSIALTCW